jgi:hypothetical protein
MATDSIADYMKPGFPVFTDTSGEFLTVLEYVGPRLALVAPGLAVGRVWGSYPGTVSYYELEPGENEEYATLKVTCSFKYEPGQISGVERVTVSVRAEVEWVDVQRPLQEHPEFQGVLTARDLVDVDLWKQEQNPELRASYQYNPDPENPDAEPVELSEKAQKLAEGFALGIEGYVDHAPVFRKITTYLNGYPPDSSAGMKQAPSMPAGSPGPSGYEWIKTADRAIQTGEKNRWDRVEEWTGAQKVLVDKDRLYY